LLNMVEAVIIGAAFCFVYISLLGKHAKLL